MSCSCLTAQTWEAPKVSHPVVNTFCNQQAEDDWDVTPLQNIQTPAWNQAGSTHTGAACVYEAQTQWPSHAGRGCYDASKRSCYKAGARGCYDASSRNCEDQSNRGCYDSGYCLRWGGNKQHYAEAPKCGCNSLY